MRKILLVVLMLVLTLTLTTACVNNNKTDTGAGLTGKYSIVSITAEGETHDAAALEAFGMAGTFIEFLDGGKVNYFFVNENLEGTFKVDGSSVTVTIDGDSMTGKIDGNRITLNPSDDDEGAMIFEKK